MGYFQFGMRPGRTILAATDAVAGGQNRSSRTHAELEIPHRPSPRFDLWRTHEMTRSRRHSGPLAIPKEPPPDYTG